MAAAGSTAQPLEEIETALLRLPRPPAPLYPHNNLLSSAYAALLHLMGRCSSAADASDGPSELQALTLHCPSLITVMISDIALPDEETAAQALKCLGFMAYHPALSSAIPGPISNQVVDSLARLVVTTKMKVICNLGVWCISVQQLDTPALCSHFHSLLQAIVHALDNPFGSLSTTLEATQAVVKLVTQLCEKMRGTSDVWAPPIYRRLLSVDKKERDMSERCLLKIQSVLLPPPLALSKATVVDVKQKLLPAMMGMLQGHLEKVQTIKSWGWYIRLIGSYALRNRFLINELLKIPEKAFTDPDPQVKIASLVSWESLIDALLPSEVVALGMGAAHEDCLQIVHAPSTSIGNPEIQIDGLLKRVKLIMVPLLGILSSNCDISVRSTGLNTWHYLLQKLNISINVPSMRTLVLEPVLEIVFSKGPGDKNIWLWNSCLDLLDEFVLSKLHFGKFVLSEVNFGSESPNDLKLCHFLLKASSGPSAKGKDAWKDCPVRWLPWELNDLNFLIRMIDIIVHQGADTTITLKSKLTAFSAASRIFRSVLKCIQAELRRPSTNYTEIQLCIKTILTFVKDVCDDITLGSIDALKSDILSCVLHILEAVKEELEPSVLASSLYRVALDVKYICDLESAKDAEYLKVLGIAPILYMDMVSPLVYLEILYLSEIAQSMLDLSETNTVLQKVKLLEFILFSLNPMISLHAFICFLYMHCKKLNRSSTCLLSLWRVVAVNLKEHIDAVNGLAFLKAETDNAGHTLMYWFLCYPLVCVTFMESLGPAKTNSEFCLVYSEKQLEFDSVIESWKLLFNVANHATQCESSPMNNFIEGLAELLITVLDEHVSIFQSCISSSSTGTTWNFFGLSLYGDVSSYMIRDIQLVGYASLASAIRDKEGSKCKQESHMKNSLVLVSRFLLLLLEAVKTNPTAELPCISRIFDAMSHMLGKICLKMDIVLLIKILSDPLGHWLYSCPLLYTEMQHVQILSQLHLCWKQLLDCSLRSQPPIFFDSSFLEVQAPLLQAALDNQYSPISKSTQEFWKATYGKQTNLYYPEILLPVLDKLSRSGLIKLQKKTCAFMKDCNSSVGKSNDMPQSYAVSTSNKITQRVGFTDPIENNSESPDDSLVRLEKKRSKRHELSTSVNVIHQDLNADCHAPAPRARADFSQGSRHSEKKRDLRKSGCILKMMRRPT